MYLPSHFAEDDLATLHALIRTHPLGTWVTRGDDVPGGITADHVPFMLDAERGASVAPGRPQPLTAASGGSERSERGGPSVAPGRPKPLTAPSGGSERSERGGPYGTLRCHVARANPVWQRVAAAPDVQSLVVFQGADAYISPSWYATKREHGKVVPTWNYATVHVMGAPRVVEDTAWLRSLVETLTTKHESPRPQPWAVDDAPADYVEAMLRAIVGIEIPIMSIAGKWKVSQNHPAANQRGVADGLHGDGSDTTARDMAELVRERIRKA
jgi:transcriptional regulator